MERSAYADYVALERDHWWFSARRRIFIDLLTERLGTAAWGDIVDLGVGAGVFTDDLTAHGDVVGVEYDGEAATVARERGLRIVEASVTDIPLETSSYDLACALDVLEHVPDDAAGFREIARILRPGGLLLLTVPAVPRLWSDHDLASHHHRRYRRRQLRRRLVDAGFEVERLVGLNVILAPVVVAARIAQQVARGSSAGTPRSDVSLPSAPVNRVLESVFASERHLLRRATLPVGVSLLAVARVPEGAAR